MSAQSGNETTATLIELAIKTEKALQDLYASLVQRYSHWPPVADFWRKMGQDEDAHARGLEKIRDSLTPEQLQAPVDSVVLEQAKRNASLSVEDKLNSISILEDAYQLAHDLEHSEINTVFEFITAEFISLDVQREFVAAQLKKHVARLGDFPNVYRLMDKPSR
jgi:rubrerythrin